MIKTIDAYETRIIAYADIMGWSEASKDTSQCKRLKTTVKKIADHAVSFSREIKNVISKAPGISDDSKSVHASIEFSFFSDNFAVSAPDDYGQKIFEILAWTSHELLREKFLVRGGVTIGKLFHQQGMIFGPALVEAVELERGGSEESHYPCILCSEELSQYLGKTNSMDEVIITDSKNKLIVNIALESILAKDDLIKIVNGELIEIKKVAGIWIDLQTELLKNYEAPYTKYLKTSIERELFKLNKIEAKWEYMREMLPKMYEARAIK